MPDWYEPLLICPDCGGCLEQSEVWSCVECGFASRGPGGRDLKPVDPQEAKLRFSRVFASDVDEALHAVETRPPPVTYTGPGGKRDSAEMMSEISRYAREGAKLLDLGCGPRDQAVPAEHLGLKYVGIDYSGEAADLLADAHALPFASASFDVVLSYAVLEHLHNPFVAIQEVARVLKPGGIYIGTVSQGEPFHCSFFHHTAWGILSLISTMPELAVRRLWATGDTLFSLKRMGRYPRVIRSLLGMVGEADRRFPWLAPRRNRWSAAEKRIDGLHRAGSIGFVIQRLTKS